MIYFDYAATTPANKEVLDTFVKVSNSYFANPNSLHSLGSKTNDLITSATKQISNILNIKESEIIYTSGASEANNTVIKNVLNYKNRGNHIITTNLEHDSINEPLRYLEQQGFIIDYVNLKDGLVDLEHLDSLLTDKTVLVSIAHVNSEIGLTQDLVEISKVVRKYKKCYFHSDVTQSVGKIDVDFSILDFASMSAHKVYGIKGIGILFKKVSINIEPLIHGGKSTNIYRSGTPTTELIVSYAKALRLIFENKNINYKKLTELNDYLVKNLKEINNITLNNNENCIKNIINISVDGIKPESLLHHLEQKEIYISTKTACSKGGASKSVYAFTNDIALADSSLRISLSHLTTKKEIETFLIELKNSIEKLTL